MMDARVRLVHAFTLSYCALTVQVLGQSEGTNGKQKPCHWTGQLCNSTHVYCQDGTCVKNTFFFHGPRTCHSGNLKQCADKTCIFTSTFCDGKLDCPDGSDETGCSSCKKGSFLCANGRCVDENILCNGFDDCGDNSDEGLSCQSNSPSSTTPGVDELKPRSGVTVEQWLYIICGTAGFVIVAACLGCCCLNIPTRHKTRLRSALSIRREQHLEQELPAIRVINDYTPEPEIMRLQALSRTPSSSNDQPPSYEIARQVSTPLLPRNTQEGGVADTVDSNQITAGLLAAEDTVLNRPPSYQEVVDGGDYVVLDNSHYLHRSLSSDSQPLCDGRTAQQTS